MLDLVDRNLTAEGPDQLWEVDITYIPTWTGFLSFPALSRAHALWYHDPMIRRIVTRQALGDPRAQIWDRDHWLGRPPAERLAAVDFLRHQVHGSSAGLQRVVRVVERERR